MAIGIGIAIAILGKDRDRDRDLNVGDRAHALFSYGKYMITYTISTAFCQDSGYINQCY